MNEAKDRISPQNGAQESGTPDLQPEFDIREIEAISLRMDTVAHAGRLTDPEAVKIAGIALKQADDISNGRLTLDEVLGTQPDQFEIIK